MPDPADLTVKKLDYSSNPWRIVHIPTGKEVWWEVEAFDHPHLGMMPLERAGYRTKRDAVESLGRLTAVLSAAAA